MPDYAKMTVEALRALARKLLGPGHSKKSKRELIAALEKGKAPAPEKGGRARAPTKAARGEKAPRSATAKKAGAAAQRASRAARAGAKAIAEAGRAVAQGAAEGARSATRSARARKPGKVKEAVAAVAGAAAGAIAGVAAARKAARARRAPEEGPDPEGYFVARVRGEDAVREAPHPMTEAGEDRWNAPAEPGALADDEKLGDLPWGYGDDAFVALPRDPRTLFLYWDLAPDTVARGFEGFDRPRVQLWVFALGATDFERVRIVEFALESRGFYVHDLEPGRVYRAEIHAVDRAGRERRLSTPSNEVALPTVGPSPIVDDRFVRIPWDLVLGRLLGPGHAGAPFSEEARALLARLSDWSRFQGPTWGGSAGGMGGRPSSPTSWPSSPSSPSSPFGGGR
jgi:hypothetical protein